VINRSQSPTSSDDEPESPAVEEADYQPPTLPPLLSSVEKSRSPKFCITGEKKGCCGTEVDCPALKLIVWADSV
jgi:hypothetical protein